MKKILPKPGTKAHHRLLLKALSMMHDTGWMAFEGYDLLNIWVSKEDRRILKRK